MDNVSTICVYLYRKKDLVSYPDVFRCLVADELDGCIETGIWRVSEGLGGDVDMRLGGR